MNKLYDLITFHNGTTPALNEDNLNAMSQALDGIDDRVVSLGGAVLEVIPDLEDMLSNAEMLQQYKEDAEAAAGSAEDDKEDAEAWAVGKRNGVDVPSTDPAYHNNAKYYSEQTNPTLLENLSDVAFTLLANGQVLTYNSTTQKWENKPGGSGGTAASVSYDNTSSGLAADDVQEAIDEVNSDLVLSYKVTTKRVDTSSWQTDTTSQSGVTLYKKYLNLNHVYTDRPTVDIGCVDGSVLPTTAQQEAYDLLEYVTLYESSGTYFLVLYASDIPTDAFYINVEGCD